MDMKKEQWNNGKKGIEKIIDYAKEIGLYNVIKEWKNKPKSIKDHNKEVTNQDADENEE
jgi:hypothetical protein